MNNSETGNPIEFTVALSGSHIFDMHTKATANGLCAMFPGLKYKEADNHIRIYGQLNDYWYEVFKRTVFNIGEQFVYGN